VKIIVLATASTSTWLLVNSLKESYLDIQVGIERPVSRWMLMRRRVGHVGVWRVFGQILFILFSIWLRRSSRQRVKTLINNAGLSIFKPEVLNVRNFDSVNSEACVSWLISEAPDVVIINGTRIVSSVVLDCSDAVFLNIHCGITPAYRGVHGGYWALQRQDAENAGVTVHLVDSGVDTGGVLYQAAIDVDQYDNFITYPVKQYIVGIPLMKQALKDVAEGRVKVIVRDDLSSAIWQHPTLWQYLKDRWFRGVY